VLGLLERALPADSTTLATAVVRTRDARREQGEIAVEAAGTLTVVPASVESLPRIDVREVNATMQALAQSPLLAAFRYQRGARPPALALSVQRFTAADVVAAVAEYAEATTLITDDGRALTEVRLTVRNRAQRFMRLALPAGATVVSAMLDDAPVKPVGSADGVRVPLARAGARAWDTTEVSFVYLHAGTPFARRARPVRDLVPVASASGRDSGSASDSASASASGPAAAAAAAADADPAPLSAGGAGCRTWP